MGEHKIIRCRECAIVKEDDGSCACNMPEGKATRPTGYTKASHLRLVRGDLDISIQSPGYVTRYCQVFRGPDAPPAIMDPDTDMSQCAATPAGAKTNCTPEEPLGLWPKPFELIIPASSDLEIKLFETTNAVLQGLSFKRVKDSATNVGVDPEMVEIGDWSTGKKKQLYPGYGSGTVPSELEDQEPAKLFCSITDYSDAALAAGLSKLIPVLARLNLRESTKGLRFTLRNLFTFEVKVKGYWYVNYAMAKKMKIDYFDMEFVEAVTPRRIIEATRATGTAA